MKLRILVITLNSPASGGAIPIQFQFGRRDAVSCPAPKSRLPNAQLGRAAINQVFITQMGLTLSDAITLIGAHTIGRVHPEYSGYGGASSIDASSFSSSMLDMKCSFPVTPTPTKVSTAQQLQANAWDATPQTFDNGYYSNMINVVRLAARDSERALHPHNEPYRCHNRNG